LAWAKVAYDGKAAYAAWNVSGFRQGKLQVLNENRKLTIKNGRFADRFKPLAVHVYRQTLK